MKPIEVTKTFRGKHVLIAGASGFLGKVWLCMLLSRLPEIGRIYVVLRKKGSRPVEERFEQMMTSSYVFKPLHELYGEKLSEFLSARVEVVEGDVTQPFLGIQTSVLKRLQRDLDLVVNCSGLVDFEPELHDSIAVNVDGALHTAEFTESCEHATLLHISTCYVAGVKEGRIPETVDPNQAPNGLALDPVAELADVKRTIDRILAQQKDPKVIEKVRAETAARMKKHHLDDQDEVRLRALMRTGMRRWIRESFVQEGRRRVEHWGWTNIYTYTKGLAEAVLVKKFPKLRMSILRPSIVESSLAFPFPGWNEGFNTSGPLAYLLGTWFRFLPAKRGNPFDVVPVDTVCNAMTTVGAALMLNRAPHVVHVGTSDRNLFTIDRACELTSLSHRTHYRKVGKTRTERLLLSRWDTVVAEPDYWLSIGNLRKGAQFVHRLTSRFKRRNGKPFEALEKLDRRLELIEKTVHLFMPFIHDYHYVFETKTLTDLPVTDSEFSFHPETMDWRNYWLNIHMPSLRRWCFPIIEGKQQEKYVPQTPVQIKRPAALRPVTREVETETPILKQGAR